eukprot:TRINITY_DN2575_c0_g1_i4.p1 TRINITY_DN2575_c0_g1~~TRINITY_DN2575_c0_g1_i4.p1  ORF type:complete len:361 (+),score=106.93 TRINITY_DN2575_c0_g1_i4:51-1133(+)
MSTKNNKLPPPPKNIFVTQIKEDLDSGYDQLRQHPIVKQNAASLVKNSSKTQQSTLLLQRQQQLSLVDTEHKEAIKRFKLKTEELKRREDLLREKRKKLDERKLKFANYIRDEKSRQQNALNKIELASKEIKEKDSEIAELEEERDAVRNRHIKLVKKNAELKRYKVMLEKAVESMPDGYIEIVGNSPADSLILKYQTLKDTQTNLQQRLQDLTEELETKQIQKAIECQLNSTDLLDKNQSLSKNQSVLETERGQCAMLDQLIAMKEEYAREQKRILAMVQLAISNIGGVCYQHRYSRRKPVKMSVFEQLNFIEDFILDLEQTVELAVRMSEESSGGVERDSPSITRTHLAKSIATLSLK